MDWKLKSLAFRGMASIPGHDAVHLMAQRHIMRSMPRGQANLKALQNKAALFCDAFRRHSGKPLEDCTFLEIGSGRDLSVPLALRSMGVGKVITLDIKRLARLDLVAHAATYMFKGYQGKLPALSSWDAVSTLGIDYRAPATIDAVRDPIDCFVSNEVLEHIPLSSLESIMRTARTIANGPDALSIHAIDYSDHYARTDPNIDRFNFLKFSEQGWHRYNHSDHFVNRLRASDYAEIFKDCGWLTAEETRQEWPHPLTCRDDIDERFSHYSDDDLFSINGTFVLQRGP